MKNVICLGLSFLVAFSSCTQKKNKSDNRPAPSAEVPSETVTKNENQMEQGFQSDGQKKISFELIDTAVTSLMQSRDVFIKSYDGATVSLEKYKLNPSQYYMLFKKNKSSTGYNALNSSVSEDALNTIAAQSKTSVTMNYKLYLVEGSMDDFNGANLGEPVHTDTVEVSLKAADSLLNQANYQAFFEKLKGVNLASEKGALEQIKGFLMPTAYADFDEETLMWTAIIASSTALIAYSFAFWQSQGGPYYGGVLYTIGGISAATATVFWLLYWFNDEA